MVAAFVDTRLPLCDGVAAEQRHLAIGVDVERRSDDDELAIGSQLSLVVEPDDVRLMRSAAFEGEVTVCIDTKNPMHRVKGRRVEH